MRRLLFCLLLLFLACPVLGQERKEAFTISWVGPTIRADDSPLPVEEIDKYKVYCGTEQNLILVGEFESDVNEVSFAELSVEDGIKYCGVSGLINMSLIPET